MLQMQYLGNDTFPMLEVDVEDNEVKGFRFVISIDPDTGKKLSQIFD